MLKKILSLILSLLIALPLLAACKQEADPYEGKLLLSDHGESNYRIVTSADASDTLYATACELQKYFYAITGATLEIVDDTTEAAEHEIVLGKTTRNEGDKKIDRVYLGDEGFCIRNAGESIFIAGGEDRGTLYGVYAFLEEYLGVRYWAEHEETVPRKSTLFIDKFEDDNIQKPGFEFRLQSHQTAKSYTEKMHLNGAWSGDYQPIAGGIEYTGPWYVHTFGSLIGWNSSHSYCRQPCLNDENTFQKMFDAACKYIEENPNATVISISQNDSTLANSGECKCEHCFADQETFGSSGAMLIFINRMANALKSKYPHIYVETLAYYYTQEPPKGGITPAENVIVRFCNAGGCMLHSYESESPDATGLYPENNRAAYENLKGWAEVADLLYIWDYNIDFGSALTMIPNLDRLYENITTYYKLGADGIYMQGMRDGGELDRLRGYLTSKLLWNPRMSYADYEALIAEFLVGYYGKAAPFISEYIDYMEEICRNTHPAMYHDFTRFIPLKNADGQVDRTHLEVLKKFYENALEAADNYEMQLRVRRALMPILYYETLVVAAELSAEGADDAKVEQTLFPLNKNLRNEMKVAGIKNVKEGQAIPSLPNWKNTMLYWGWDGRLIYDEASAAAHEKAKEDSKNGTSSDGNTIDVTQGQLDAEKESEQN
ncbi:MAG: DUF4838 domain-containing protein [Clostridia bacterium]|nr:DUF4838 domain-containing protein [Clostridia bacterium]